MNRFNLVNNVLGWATFVIALVTYTLTLEPTVSFWDCGEFISASYRLQICHPPGAPLFLLFGRIFSLFASDVSQVAFWVNMVSATTSALCIMFTFWIITHLGRKLLVSRNEELNGQQTVAVLVAGLVGALATTWSDTFWFSAVEAEVYASSSFFTMLTFWCILKWENVADEKGNERWLVLIAYLIGLAIGVHLLSILVIPAIVYVYYFRKNKFTRNGFIGASMVAIAAIAIVQFGIIPGMPSLATKFDYFFVNTLGMSINSGAITMLVVIAATLAAAIHYSQTNSQTSFYVGAALYAILVLFTFSLNPSFSGVVFWGAMTGLIYYFLIKGHAPRAIVNVAFLSVTFIIIGYSCYAMVLIRSNAKPAINMNAPDNPFSLYSYLQREQYGENPLLYGQYFYAKVVDEKKGAMQYAKTLDGKSYEATGEKIERIYDPKDCTILPRMWADRADYIRAYREWENIPEGKKATFGKNIHFMLDYQIRFMWWRYFAWNVIGRQNDDQGYGDITRGNLQSGIPFIDAMWHGPQDNIPESISSNKANNKYYFLPFIFGLIGMFYHFRKSKEDATVITTLFLFTGVFIVLYLNFPAHQPRERDYAYVGSYQTFFIWVGLGVLGLIDWLAKKMNITMATGIASITAIAGVPVLLVSQNWDDHDRSNRYAALHFAEDYLNSCAPNAILFTNGDNDTYPLWYAQNVEGIRSDIRVINLSLLNTDWYADALKTKVYDSEPINFSMTRDKYKQGTRDYVIFYQNPEVERQFGINQNDYYPLSSIMKFITDDNDPMSKLTSQSGMKFSYYPTKKFYIPIDKEQILKTGTVPEKDAHLIVDTLKWEIGNGTLMKADLIVLDILSSNNWERPIYFAITTGSDVYLNLMSYFRLEGLTYRIVPIKNTDPTDAGTYGHINTDIMYDNLVNKFKWGNMDVEGVYLDETTLRQTRNFRNLFYRLAIKLVAEGDTTRAIKAIDKCVEVMPKSNVPYDIFIIRLAEAYYAAGANDKAENLLKQIVDQAAEKYAYYNRFKGKQRTAVHTEVEENTNIMMYAMQVAQINRQDELFKYIKGKTDAVMGAMAPSLPPMQ
jgi:hypothetical protein